MVVRHGVDVVWSPFFPWKSKTAKLSGPRYEMMSAAGRPGRPMSSPTSGQLRKEVTRISDHKLWHPCCSSAPSLTTYTPIQMSRAFATRGEDYMSKAKRAQATGGLRFSGLYSMARGFRTPSESNSQGKTTSEGSTEMASQERMNKQANTWSRGGVHLSQRRLSRRRLSHRKGTP